MGVHGLWDIVGPSARPVRVEALRNKKLAVDASIWIYQFLKAVRDREGNQLKNSHIVGFLRRICKLLYFGIKPVFVFDGGVPTLKKDTIRKRREKREGNKESIEQTAKRILAKQLQLLAEGKLKRPNASALNATRREMPTEELYYDAYYDDQVGDGEVEPLKEAEVPKEKESRMFRGQDDFDLPNHGPIKVTEDDKRVMTGYEYDRLTQDINDDLDGLDLDNIDPQSEEFEKLPLSTQYIALSHLRLRSRLRLGYTKDQLQSLFPDPMEFSKFQIKMVQKRNFFTQKVMNVTGMDGDAKQDVVSRRIASDKNRAYDLRRTGDGYALSISKDTIEGVSSSRPIFLGDVKEFVGVDHESPVELEDSEEDVDWDDFEVLKERGKPDSTQVKTAIEVENPLFIKDSDQSSGESDEENVEMEDVPLENDDLEDDDIMKKIKYLYEYSNTHNKGKGPKNTAVELSSEEDDNIDDYQELQIQQVEDDELKQAIEKSKKDYLNTLNEEKNGSGVRNTLEHEAPIILSTSTLAKTLKLPKLNMKDNLLFGRRARDRRSKVADVESKIKNDEDNDSITEKKKALPLPEWFSNQTSFAPKPTVQSSKLSRNLTEDEKAGLLSYGDIETFISNEEENDVIDLDDLSFVENSVEAHAVEPKKKQSSVVEIIDSPKHSQDNSPLNIPNSSGLEIEDKKTDDADVIFPSLVSEVIEKEAEPKIQARVNEEKVENFPASHQQKSPKLTVKLADENVDNSMNSVQKTLASKFSSHEAENTQKPHIDDESDFSDEEEVNLLLDMEEENLAYDKFYRNIGGNKVDDKKDDGLWTFTDEARLQERLRKQKRDADEVSTKMIYDVQDLLARFGIPFITAPMEAEAQCAELELIGLVDGIITDDSDCFLFGGDRVYKNLFNEKNFVECYQDADILRELGLNRSSMIELAILLGSDYTDGLKGIGKVTAVEILAEFGNLENFKQWWVDYQNGKIDQSKDTPLRKKLRKSLSKSLFLGNDFPNRLIYDAYLHPEVDHDKTEFKWGYPDLDKLRTFLAFYVGWNKEKVDEIILPVIKSLNKPQSTIEEFFPVEVIQSRRQLDMSKRIKNATDKLKKGRGKQTDDESQSKRQKV
ncbi:hypothetical protein PMKS-004079 [Pichia membranifaciens]|uniref:DNA repair protein n=1 Tax=Pichia membranifaciens TaxID=4926 RepID=A0A1Q2YLZ2_9ASCO|nr:hypothetical protein PMKS-004079 [Pichia membranifaciens]